jgi:shikimate dehydrogenase
MSDSYAVIGNPVAHSKSPVIHAAFAAQTSQDIVYKAMSCETAALAAAVAQFREAGGKGMNVTLPFKHEASRLANWRSVRAQAAGAANTLTFNADGITADNTDGVGLTRDITANLGVNLRGKRLLLMGAGGASYGVTGPLLEEAPAVLVIANRTLSKAQALVRRFLPVAARCALAANAYEALSGKDGFDVVINATSAGLSNDMPALPDELFAPGALAYDMVYGRITPFMAFAQARGVRTVDGLGMLVEQAAESFYIWRRVRPQTAPVMALLRGAGG